MPLFIIKCVAVDYGQRLQSSAALALIPRLTLQACLINTSRLNQSGIARIWLHSEQDVKVSNKVAVYILTPPSVFQLLSSSVLKLESSPQMDGNNIVVQVEKTIKAYLSLPIQ